MSSNHYQTIITYFTY